MHRVSRSVAAPVICAAGLFVSLVSGPAEAQAQAPELEPQIIDLGAMTDAQIGPLVPHIGTLRSKTLVATPDGTVAVQSGDVPKHTHQHSVEIQYVISGSGTFWLGDKQRHVHPGDLIIIPENTVHGGSMLIHGRLKVLSIKLPPQQPGDMQMAP
ncbi:cupin domain-containing protein [Trinickia dinghuensis]|uniref:Cupin domain-containing protein n=1 Tax=Trinickia dinghuensis TaxID=2291023 RepID=A0A3D8JTX6_9BURK|nr:cupin domain-containing protein [Trinickia dinghuensis]RDU96116.1 cupin domain-containing protein [Trinickia dinghuensis]